MTEGVMNNHAQYCMDFARKARDEGIQRAADHAGQTWMDLAVTDLVRFLRSQGPSTVEAWRFNWLAHGNPAPASHKAWGAVASSAARRGLIVNTGKYVKAKSIKTHAHPVPVWAAASP